MSDETAKRGRFDQTVAGFEDRRITSVAYWNLMLPDDAPPRWDYGEWHHAEMGVELSTDQGPISLRCTDTFWSYGIEVAFAPMSDLIGHGWERSEATRVPVGIRLDFDAETVWSIAGIPQPPDMREVFVPGDEVMVVFAADRVRQIGFPEEFIAASSPGRT